MIDKVTKPSRRLMLALGCCLAAAGCATDPSTEATSSMTSGGSSSANREFASLTYRAVDLLLAGAPQVTADTPMIVASIADTQNLNKTSAFGNILSDMIRTRLVQNGRKASEPRLRSSIGFNRGRGEFLLSRNPRALLTHPRAAAIVTGTYAAGYDTVYVSIKLLSSTDARIISGADFVVPIQGVLGMIQFANAS